MAAVGAITPVGSLSSCPSPFLPLSLFSHKFSLGIQTADTADQKTVFSACTYLACVCVCVVRVFIEGQRMQVALYSGLPLLSLPLPPK